MRIRKQSGFTMIEVLISVLVLALGVIGVAGMQIAALRSNQQSGSQSTAVQIASEMADAMRANPTEMNKPDASNPFLLKGSYTAGSTAPLKTGVTNCITSNCDTAQLATFEIYEWHKKIYESLPGGRVAICRDSAPWDATNKKLSWTCSAYAASVANNGPIVIKLGWKGKGKKADGSELGANEVAPPVLAITVESYTK